MPLELTTMDLHRYHGQLSTPRGSDAMLILRMLVRLAALLLIGGALRRGTVGRLRDDGSAPSGVPPGPAGSRVCPGHLVRAVGACPACAARPARRVADRPPGGWGTLGGRAAGEPPVRSVARLLQRAARLAIVGGGPDRGPGCLCTPPGGWHRRYGRGSGGERRTTPSRWRAMRPST